jgi:hypothetical protein
MASKTTKKIPDTAKVENTTGATELNTPEELAQEAVTKATTEKKKTTRAKVPTTPKKPVTTRLISATSKVSTELEGCWYSFSFSESREVNDDSDMDAARLDLWNTVHTEVDNQVQYTIESIKGSAPAQQNVAGVPNTYSIPEEYNY